TLSRTRNDERSSSFLPCDMRRGRGTRDPDACPGKSSTNGRRTMQKSILVAALASTVALAACTSNAETADIATGAAVGAAGGAAVGAVVPGVSTIEGAAVG